MLTNANVFYSDRWKVVFAYARVLLSVNLWSVQRQDDKVWVRMADDDVVSMSILVPKVFAKVQSNKKNAVPNLFDKMMKKKVKQN